jgi:triacylglycerol esterase/lipase EstA (alpha/beta hydrolase family)
MKRIAALLLILLLAGCTTTLRTEPELLVIDQSRIASPDLKITIPGLGPCTDNPERTLRLNPQEPVVVLVHGCLGSAGRFRALAEVFAFSGQQAVCFSYNDRDSLMVSSAQLITSLEKLAGQTKNRRITVIGHSQGGLIARKALVKSRHDHLKTMNADLDLVTVSAPFSGIMAAGHCSSTLGRIFSLGLTVPICMIVSGDKWHEITGASEFIRLPGELLGQVGRHLKIDTDETGSCRRTDDDNNCAESDYVFGLEEQRHPAVDGGAVVTGVKAKAGHVEIVGDHRVAPLKLIAILQEKGILKTVQSEQLSEFRQLLTSLYQ